MTDDTQQTIIGYTIEGNAGKLTARGLDYRNVRSAARAALEAVTGDAWDAIELRNLRGETIWDIEGSTTRAGAPEESSGRYRLELTIGHPGRHALSTQQRADLVTARGTLRRAAIDPDSLDFETAASMLDRVTAALCPHDPSTWHIAPDVTNGRPLVTCEACGYTWYNDFSDHLSHVRSYAEDRS